MDWLRRENVYVLCAAITLAYCSFFVWLAAHLTDPHLANRGGALLAAFGAAAVVWQVSREIRLEGANDTDDDATEEEMAPLHREITERLVKRRQEYRRIERMKVVIAIAGVLVAGELMHGWGDCLVTAIDGESAHKVAHD